MFKLLVGFLVSFYFAQSLRAWNAEGHMLVSQIAYNHLSPAAKAKCDELIAVPLVYGGPSNNTFVTAAVWADDHRAPLGTSGSHFINLPFSLDGTPTNGFTPPAFDVVKAINQSIAVLQNPDSVLTNQATHLRYLLHFVGDIQQPLHCVTAVSSATPNGDAGGNAFTFSGGRWGNVHFLWDEGGGYLTNSISRPLNPTGQAILDSKAAAAETNYSYSANPNTIPNPMTWAMEGLELAKTVSYVGVTRNTTPSAGYLNTVKASAEQRMVMGGRRLADLLNTLFAPSPVALTPGPVSNGTFAFTWVGLSNASYRVEWKHQLSDPMWNVLTNITATNNSVLFSDAVSQTQRLYQVV